MHQHGPNELLGPLRGSRAWWRGLEAAPEITGDGPQVKLGRKGRKPKRTSEDKGIRTELVARVRQEIAAGTYDRPEIWEQALDRLLQRLEGE